jgi:acetyl esterase
MAAPDSQMGAVLNQLAALGGKPIETLTPEEARKQPTPADAVTALLKSEGKPTTPEPVANVANRMIDGAAGKIPARIYTPAGTGPFPVVVYYHGGGWVIATIDTYDASPRAIANAAGAVVVSVEYRKAPENPFPAAHEDAFAAYKWALAHAGEIHGDPSKIAVLGESAGGNMAAAVSMMARDQHIQMPTSQVLVYPVANGDTTTVSMMENANAKPLSRPMMGWFAKQTLKSPSDMTDPRFDILDAPSLAGLPPTTIILAQIDPLRTGGDNFGLKLKAAGVKVDSHIYDGVTHEFFGMGAAVDKAKDAVKFAADGLKSGFSAAPAAKSAN